MADQGFHEDPNLLSESTKDYHRIIESTMEELEAIDWYNQRAEAATDPAAKAIMEHNRDEEIEHACMGLEWLRRNSPVWDAMMQKFLFSSGDIVVQESAVADQTTQTDTPPATPSSGTLKIGSNS
ncbi:MAG: ferritin-like domain-containing protein [Sulfuricurvum sp.]|uniref:ferritin-like domain-containing protein n=1 Tax=Sulfuricurvum sp. TaxID=2025608 RepID=UPI00261F5C49|nr:ferritin-like domain-containing protein [Sulfuricurvum sp.]MDD2369659.1 ferritin-like domain-containing protein [Sulfuricurvum sp.]MDD2950469.1 ferritin-like domain-containing protein [Sulfuricurvum sp.]MDD5119288.1 ferritin-like domain-containing protein [Sulfuricurvum sp.]